MKNNEVIIDWHARAKALKIDGRAFINGKRVHAVDHATFECFSPIDNRKLVDVASCKSADIDLAVASDRHHCGQSKWQNRSGGIGGRNRFRLSGDRTDVSADVAG